MKTILSILVGLIPAACLRYAILRRPLKLWPAVCACFGILIAAAIILMSGTQRRFSAEDNGIVGGPLPILTDFVGRMVTIAVPVIVISFFILRAKSLEK